MEIIDRTLARISFQTKTDWVECYLHEDNLAPKLYTVVERHGRGNRDFTLTDYDDLGVAMDVYEAAAVRTKARILSTLETEFKHLEGA